MVHSTIKNILKASTISGKADLLTFFEIGMEELSCGTLFSFMDVQNGKPKCFGCDCGVHNYSCIKNKN